MRGTAIELRNKQNTGWAQKGPEDLLAITYPTSDVMRSLEAVSAATPGKPVVATAHPDVATVERMVKKRRSGTIYIDYLQNIYGKTLACAYSARASEFAGVSTPLAWTEIHGGVKSGLAPQDFTIRSIFSRLDQIGDLWAGLRTTTPANLESALGRPQA